MQALPATSSHSSSLPDSLPRLTSSSRSVLPQRTPRSRTVLIASSDASLRQRLRQALSGLRWQVFDASCGAEAWAAASEAQMEAHLEALVVDLWLPDLAIEEFLGEFQRAYPQVDLLMVDGTLAEGSRRSSYHQELLYALRRSQATDTVSWNAAPVIDEAVTGSTIVSLAEPVGRIEAAQPQAVAANAAALNWSLTEIASGTAATRPVETPTSAVDSRGHAWRPETRRREQATVEPIPELVGAAAAMIEVSRRIRLVAARTTPVLIEGPTGTGKELVAEALHRLSSRSKKPFVAINCAAIPEALLESELFGHTRGAFTGAVQGRTGRIESADGGTLFLDEIGEMPLALQAKLLRFFESGELQRIGDNETVKVDVRILAATHQPLAEDAQKGNFRADLYYRLAVFLIRTPALVEHMDDLPQLVEHFLAKMGRRMPIKRVDRAAMARLSGHSWPGNVRELEHVLERASILAGDEPTIGEEEIDFGLAPVH
uniref:Sigma-54 activating ATPase (Modular protein) n=1 Tax=mine drainage metagenome TaxID=410659 RepID=E6QMC0_9ZZZZ